MALGNEELLVRIRGIDGLSAPAKKAEQSLRSLGNQAKRSQIQMNQFGGSLTGVGKNMRKWSMGALQQAGYQVGDFAVQVANGTSRMQAFGQQAPQLLQIFGPLGAAVGAGVAIFAAFGVAAEKMSGQIKGAEEASKKLKSAIEALALVDFVRSAEGMASGADIVLSKYGAILDAIEKVSLEQRKAAMAVLRSEIIPEGSIEDAQGRLDRMIEKSRKAGQDPYERKTVVDALRNLERQKFIREQLLSIAGKTKEEAAAQLNQVMMNISAEGYMTQELRNQLLAFAQQNDIQQAIRQEFEKAVEAAKVLTVQQQQNAYIAERNGKAMVGLNNALVIRNALEDDYGRAMQRNYATSRTQAAQVARDGISYAARTKAAYAQYYASRIAGENLVRDAQAETFRQAMIQRNRQQWIDEPSVDVAAARIKELKDKWSEFKANLEKKPKVAKVAKEIEMQLAPEMQAMEQIAKSMGQSFEDAFMSMIDGTKSAKDAFRDMTRAIIADLYRQFVVKQITGFIGNAISSAFIPNVAAPSMGIAGKKAAGGPVRAGLPYLVGEKGPEIVVPSRNATVIPNNKIGGGDQVVVNQTINVTTGIQQTVRTEIKSLMPQIAESAKAAVLDAKRRGGSYGRNFA